MKVWKRWRGIHELRVERRRATWSGVDPAAQLDRAWADWNACDPLSGDAEERLDPAARAVLPPSTGGGAPGHGSAEPDQLSAG